MKPGYTIVNHRLERIVRLLRKHYPIRYVVGHSDITPRKSDPGLALKYVELFLNV